MTFLIEREYDQHAFKLKKPLRTPYFTHRSLDARHRNSVAEIRLNRRFAAGVYLDAVPVTYDSKERVKVDSAGEVVDWLVKMRRLDESRMLDFYQAFRAALRANLAAAHLDEARFKDSVKWRSRTIEYLDLACRRLE